MTSAGISSPWTRTAYRIRQFLGGFRATVTPEEMQEAARILPPAANDLFRRMPADARRHSLNVLHSLQAQGEVGNDLAAAALLHDAGKLAADDAGAPITLWKRGPLVLLEALAPRKMERLASADPATGWRYAVHVHCEHPAIGALWAQECGCSPLTCRLIAAHQQRIVSLPDAELAQLRRLQAADNLH
jgi:hypothetical protein